MIKYLILPIAFILLIFPAVIRAQQLGSLWVNGVSGINSNWILNQNAYGNPEMDYAATSGITGGVGASYFYSRKWGLNGSLLYSNLGQNYSGIQSGAQAKRKVKLSYLEFPVLLMKRIPYVKYPTWIAAGPDIRILLKASQDYSRDNSGSALPNPDGMTPGDITGRFKHADIALNISLNRMYKLNYSGSMMFLVSANSSFGITDVNAPAWQTPNLHNSYGRSRNLYIGVNIGLMFKAAQYGRSHW